MTKLAFVPFYNFEQFLYDKVVIPSVSMFSNKNVIAIKKKKKKKKKN